jgi:WD40-like Beta Propeller Repeat
MKRYRLLVMAIAVALPCVLPRAGATQDTSPQVYSDAGNIVIERNGAKTKLTSSEMDVDPVLSPNGSIVVYTRQGRGRSVHGYDVSQVCTIDPRPDELRQINADGTGDKLLLKGQKGDPNEQLCDFKSKQFSSDGRRLYFLTPGSDSSGALHVLDMRSGDDRFVIAANDLLVLNFCPNKYKDDLVVLQRRDFLLGGSYHWYWLYDSTGKKELGPLGEFDNPDDMVRQAHGVWCASKP